MKQNIRELKRAYPFLEIKTAGHSVLGKPIPYIKIEQEKSKYCTMLVFMQMSG